MRAKSEIAVIHWLDAHMIQYMKSKTLLTVAAMSVMALAAFADYDCQIISSGIGDSNLLTLGGFTFARPVSIDLMPTNAPNAGTRYSIRCQVVYKDRNLPRPKTEDEKEVARATGTLLNEWLMDLIADQYAGAEFADLLSVYYDGRLVADLNDRFPSYVAERIEGIKTNARINIAAVTVTVNAEGELRSKLVSLLRQEKTRP